MARIEVAESPDALSHRVAEQFVRLTSDAVRERGRCAVALSGGSTPKAVYRVLAAEPFRSRVPWDRMDVFWGDERHVPPDHAESNYRMAVETLLANVPVPPPNIHRIPGEMPDAALAAEQYETEIRTTFGEPARIPRFDLILLGLGIDGHTASLFPGTAAVEERRRLCVANWVAARGVYRITMTLPLIDAARTVVFIVSGAEKAPIVAQLLPGIGATHASRSRETERLPASLVDPVEGELCWMLDRAAAGQHP